jgi:hypothetical protein
VLRGPEINIPPLYDDPLSFWYIHLLFNESYHIELVTDELDPLSLTDIPAKRTAGEAVFSITVFVPIDTALAVMF